MIFSVLLLTGQLTIYLITTIMDEVKKQDYLVNNLLLQKVVLNHN